MLVKDVDGCRTDTAYALALLLFLCSTIVAILCAFAFFRENKEEQIMPLVPQLVVREQELHFSFPWDAPGDEAVVCDPGGRGRCRAITDWPDPFRPGASGVAATVRLQNDIGDLLATVVARSDAGQGQGLALCKAGCKIFGFVEPDPPVRPTRYHVRHISNEHLLTLIGDFGALDVDAVNPAGSVVCSFKKAGNACTGRVLQHVDFGMVLCTILAMKVHRHLAMPGSAAAAAALPAVPVGLGHGQGHPPVFLGQLQAAGDPKEGEAARGQGEAQGQAQGQEGQGQGQGPDPGPPADPAQVPGPGRSLASEPEAEPGADTMARALAEPAVATALAISTDSTGAAVASPEPLGSQAAAAGQSVALGRAEVADDQGVVTAAAHPPPAA